MENKKRHDSRRRKRRHRERVNKSLQEENFGFLAKPNTEAGIVQTLERLEEGALQSVLPKAARDPLSRAFADMSIMLRDGYNAQLQVALHVKHGIQGQLGLDLLGLVPDALEHFRISPIGADKYARSVGARTLVMFERLVSARQRQTLADDPLALDVLDNAVKDPRYLDRYEGDIHRAKAAAIRGDNARVLAEREEERYKPALDALGSRWCELRGVLSEGERLLICNEAGLSDDQDVRNACERHAIHNLIRESSAIRMDGGHEKAAEVDRKIEELISSLEDEIASGG